VKIAPLSQRWLEAWGPTPGIHQARVKELRALLAVARAAKRWRQFEGDKVQDPDVRRLCRTLARLDKVSR
jgi:CII-binding regulator of phage lambda lysogenization HflD